MRGTASTRPLAAVGSAGRALRGARGTARVEGRLFYRKFSPPTPAPPAPISADDAAPVSGAPGVEIASSAGRGCAGAHDPALLLDWGLALADATADHAGEARAPLDAVHAAGGSASSR